MSKQPTSRSNFGSKFGTVATAAGSAVGLGNIWKFPYEAGQNGGGAFLLIYILCVLLFGLPIMISEFAIGRRARANVAGAFRKLSGTRSWGIVGLLGVITAFLILGFYFVVAGWSLEYVYQAASNAFVGKTPTDLSQAFVNFSTDTFQPLFWTVIFICANAFVLLAGVEKGIERISKILMPFLVLILILLSIRAITMPNGSAGLQFFFAPDFSKITPNVILSALGQAFFSLSLGMGCMVTYGSYIRKDNNLTKTALHVISVDTLIAILAGVAIFPAVFSLGINPAQGPELVFITLPNVFTHMAGGYIWAILFFLLLAIAALTSTISLQEVITAYVSEEFKLQRKKVIVGSSVVLIIVSSLCSLSLGVGSKLTIGGMRLFDLFDFTSSKLFLPLGALLISIFIGWFYNPKKIRDEISNQGKLSTKLFPVYYFLMRYFVPIAIIAIFLNELGLFN
ncbi:MAG: sodium-dependent transporter [Paludibacteraceae bacterium]|jgi:NSS family neurotransmitter:Na+ symporter|nr:sodium-dependent transporter [Paludibacteraceae bacterium]HHT60670.1 sodium-dependent transporter [Bacteroidales bacterium]MBP9039509.1 sodium-dependent transporter [Paludibacteraceae bacterium]HOA46653.1 sodium-dependent transporter [Paludibacteraceae bacterium]HOG36339.1 sodium-dependent transporter [Paludibacteraceae bacterium]